MLEFLASLIEANQRLESQLEQQKLELQRTTERLQAEIDERRETEQALRTSEARLRQIFEYSNDAIFVIDPETDRILEANPQAVRQLGYSREELLSSVRVSNIHPHELEQILEFSQSVLTEGWGWTNELACLCKSGQPIPSEISASVIEFAGRKCILALVRDITDRRKAEAALRESEARFRTLVENAADMFLVLNLEGQVVDANHRACEMLGYTYEELLQLHIADIDAELTLEEVSQQRQQFQVGVPTILESTHRRKDGTTFPIEANICLFEADDRHLEISLVRDITERKQAQRAMARLAEIGELATMIVHEVRNPLTTVLLGLNSFQKLDLPDLARQRLALALDEAERLKRLLNEILLYAKPKSFQSEQLELNQFVQDLLSAACSLAGVPSHRIEFSSRLPSASIMGDRDKLKQVLINLIRNASEATEATERIAIRIGTCPNRNQVCLQVQNGGQPIPPETLSRLGTAFFTTKPQGNGLGLAIVKQIVEAHGGELQFTSTAEDGTTVSVLLPVIQALAEAR